MAATDDRLAGFVDWLDAQVPGATHEVVGVDHPDAGYSSETILVDVRRSGAVVAGSDLSAGALAGASAGTSPSGTSRLSAATSAWSQGGRSHRAEERPGELASVERLVVKLPPAGPAIFPTYDFTLQARVQEAAAAAGIPTAVPARGEEDPSWLGVPFLVMPAVEGHIVGEVPALDRRLTGADPKANRELHTTFVHLVADINRLCPGDGPAATLAGVVPHRDNAAELAYWRDYLAWYSDGEVLVPALEHALEWCVAHQPPAEPEPSLRWGDVRLENVILDDAGAPAAVLDWEMASFGAAEHDLAWLTTLQATQDALVGRTVDGFLDLGDVEGAYEERLGRPVQDIAWYEALAALRSTAILTRIAHLNDQRGEANLFPIADNPILDLLLARIGG